MSITAEEIARLCNVSRGTVDRALNGRAGISRSTRERVLRAVEQHNYTPHQIASALSKGRSMSIGVVLFDLNNRYFSQIANVISLRAKESGYLSYIAVSEKEIGSEMQILRSLAARSVDGLVLLPITQGDAYIQALRRLSMPIVTIGNMLPGIHHVSVDDRQAALESAQRIADLGYRRICFVCPPLRKAGQSDGRFNITSQALRAQGYEQFMDAHPELERCVLTQKDCALSAIRMIGLEGRTAFFCSSDTYALELLRAFRASGIRIPRDAGLMGFDNLDILDYIEPRVSTVSSSVEVQGRTAVDTLLALIDKREQPLIQHVPHVIEMGATL